MEYGKYIIVEEKGHEVAIVFDSLISHSTFLPCYNKDFVVAAGFFSVGAKKSKNDTGNIGVIVFGKSVTLETEARKDKDEKLIKKVLRAEVTY